MTGTIASRRALGPRTTVSGIAAWGSSSMAGGAATEGAPVPMHLTEFLVSTFSGRTVRNRAVGTLKSPHTRVQRGTDAPRLTFSGGRAASATSAPVTVDHRMRPLRAFRCEGTISGVRGTLHADGTRFLFTATDGRTRAASGTFRSAWRADSDGMGHLVWTGKNNITEVSAVIADIGAIVRTAPGGLAQNIVLGQWATAHDAAGTVTGTALRKVNDSQRSAYGKHFLDVQKLLTTRWGLACPPLEGLRLMSRSDVTSDVRRGVVPRALVGRDGIHLNAWGNTAVAWALLETMKDLRWL